jgi:hypothetical protein
MRKSVSMLCVAALTIAAAAAHGASVPVANSSFENPPNAPAGGEFSFGNQSQSSDAFVPGWGIITAQPVGIFTPGGGLTNVTGTQAAFIQGSAGNELYQDVGALQPNTTYLLTVAMAGNLNGSLSQATGSIQLANQVGLDGPTTTLSPIVFTSATQGPALTDYSTSFSTGPVVANDLAIVLGFAPVGGANPQIYYDNVRLTTVPEPSAWVSLVLGAAAIVATTRRRRKS